VPSAPVNTGSATANAVREKDMTITWDDGQQYFRVNAVSMYLDALTSYMNPADGNV